MIIWTNYLTKELNYEDKPEVILIDSIHNEKQVLTSNFVFQNYKATDAFKVYNGSYGYSALTLTSKFQMGLRWKSIKSQQYNLIRIENSHPKYKNK